MKKILVAIPVHNGAGWIEETLDSLLEQTYKNFEVAIVDNCSDDKTCEIVKQYTNKFIQAGITLKLFKNLRNFGRVGNWNRALNIFRESDADACKLLFVGDRLTPTCLEKQILYIDTDVATVVSCAHVVQNEDDSVYEMNHISKELDKIMKYFPREALEKSLDSGNWLAGTVANVLFSKEALSDLMFDINYEWASDWKFWVDMMAKNKVVYIGESLVIFNMPARKGYTRMAGTKKAAEEEDRVKGLIEILLDENLPN